MVSRAAPAARCCPHAFWANDWWSRTSWLYVLRLFGFVVLLTSRSRFLIFFQPRSDVVAGRPHGPGGAAPGLRCPVRGIRRLSYHVAHRENVAMRSCMR
jgi:hypothetical protein